MTEEDYDIQHTLIADFQGAEVVSEFTDSEPWEFFEGITKRKVDGTLEARVLARTGLSGRVESVERHYSSGTCEICGWGEDGITILVGNKIVFSYSASEPLGYDGDEEITSPFLVLNDWLNGAEEGTADQREYQEPTKEEDY